MKCQNYSPKTTNKRIELKSCIQCAVSCSYYDLSAQHLAKVSTTNTKAEQLQLWKRDAALQIVERHLASAKTKALLLKVVVGLLGLS